MTDLTDMWDLPEPVEYHDHGGEEVPVFRVYSPIQEPGKEPEDIPFGLLCVVCGFTPNPRVVRMFLEVDLGFEPWEQPHEEEDEWPRLGYG